MGILNFLLDAWMRMRWLVAVRNQSLAFGLQTLCYRMGHVVDKLHESQQTFHAKESAGRVQCILQYCMVDLASNGSLAAAAGRPARRRPSLSACSRPRWTASFPDRMLSRAETIKRKRLWKIFLHCIALDLRVPWRSR
jgi:hypothetical protein